MSEKIRERLGLDFLRPKSPDVASSKGVDPGLTSALMAYGWRILDFLNKSSNGTATVYELIDHVQMPIDVALQAIDYFEGRGNLEVTRRDLKGNHTVVITPAGRSMLSQYSTT